MAHDRNRNQNQGHAHTQAPSPDPAIDRAKSALRQTLREQLRRIPPSDRGARSRRACELLAQQTIWRQAHSLLFYAPLPEELDVWPLIEIALHEGKEVSLPRFAPERDAYVACHIQHLDKDLQSGRYGIREAAATCSLWPLNRLDLVLVPGLGYDLHGRRLGRGRGFYDRLLAEVSAVKCGIAFDEQIVSEIPAAPHDVRVDCILTPSRWLKL